MYRLFKPIKLLYLHRDPTASRHLKVLLNATSSLASLRNEVVGQCMSVRNDPAGCGQAHDVLLCYTVETRCTWIDHFEPTNESYFRAHDVECDHNDHLGRNRELTTVLPLTRAGVASEGKIRVAGIPLDRLHLRSVSDYSEKRWPVLQTATDSYSGRPLDQIGPFHA